MGKTEWPRKYRYTPRRGGWGGVGWGEGASRNLFHKEAQGCDWSRATFPSLSPPHASIPPSLPLPPPGSQQTLDGTQGPDHRRSVAPREYRVCTCVCVYALCLSQLGRPRPRICCGSVQWTGARQDVTSWRKLSRRHRPTSYQSTPVCPAHPTHHFKRTRGLNPWSALLAFFFLLVYKV